MCQVTQKILDKGRKRRLSQYLMEDCIGRPGWLKGGSWHLCAV